MIMTNLPDISALDETLFKVDATMGAAESHGALCGMLCARGSTDLSEWMGHVLGEQEQGNVFLRDLANQLSELHQSTLGQMNDPYGGFQLLLPDDDDELDERTEALGDWCLGFVYGLAAGGISEESELPEDTKELLMDFIEISRAGNDVADLDDDSDDGEEDEQAFVEIVEYVRTGVLLINEELQPLQTSQIIH
jgi:yecA family protein